MAQQVNLQTANERVEELYDECTRTFEQARGKAHEEVKTLIMITAGKKEESLNLKNKLEGNSISVDDIYRCQDNIEVLMDLNEKFYKILKKLSFEASEWKPILPN
jgi:hypothetical protein